MQPNECQMRAEMSQSPFASTKESTAVCTNAMKALSFLLDVLMQRRIIRIIRCQMIWRRLPNYFGKVVVVRNFSESFSGYTLCIADTFKWTESLSGLQNALLKWDAAISE